MSNSSCLCRYAGIGVFLVALLCGVAFSQSEGASDLPGLIEKLKDKDTRSAAVSALVLLKEKAKPAIPALTELLSSDRPVERMKIAMAIRKIDPQNPKILPVLLDGIKTKDETVRCFAALYMRHFGMECLPDLIALFGDSDAGTVRWASGTAAGFGKAAIPLLTKAFESRVEQVRSAAKDAIKTAELFDDDETLSR
jgi:HEAT repeat protein